MGWGDTRVGMVVDLMLYCASEGCSFCMFLLIFVFMFSGRLV